MHLGCIAVLVRPLKSRVEIVAMSGTSGGFMNAGVTAYGFAEAASFPDLYICVGVCSQLKVFERAQITTDVLLRLGMPAER